MTDWNTDLDQIPEGTEIIVVTRSGGVASGLVIPKDALSIDFGGRSVHDRP